MLCHTTHQFPTNVLPFLTDYEIAQLSYVNRQLAHETSAQRIKRKKEFVEYVMHYFCPNANIFSLHRTFQEDFEQNLRRLFRMIPEWFDYLERNKIGYLDISNPYYHRSRSYIPIMSRVIPISYMEETIDQFLQFLSTNTSLLYCNLGMFNHLISHARIENVVRDHPNIYHVEMSLYSTFSSPSVNSPASLYRMSDGTFEWRHSPPSN